MKKRLYQLSAALGIDGEEETLTDIPVAVCRSITNAMNIAQGFQPDTALEWEDLDDDWYAAEVECCQITDGFYTTPVRVTRFLISPCKLDEMLKITWANQVTRHQVS